PGRRRGGQRPQRRAWTGRTSREPFHRLMPPRSGAAFGTAGFLVTLAPISRRLRAGLPPPPLRRVLLSPPSDRIARGGARFQPPPGGEAVGGVLAETPDDDCFQGRRHVRALSRQGRRRFVQVGGEHLDARPPGERRLPGQQEIGQGADAVDVAVGMEAVLAARPFRRHVGRRAGNCTLSSRSSHFLLDLAPLPTFNHGERRLPPPGLVPLISRPPLEEPPWSPPEFPVRAPRSR